MIFDSRNISNQWKISIMINKTKGKNTKKNQNKKEEYHYAIISTDYSEKKFVNRLNKLNRETTEKA